MLLFYGGTILTLNPGMPRADTLLVDDDGRIVYVGPFYGMKTATRLRRVDLRGRTLMPGFNDAHVHIWKLGLLLTVQVDVRSQVAPDIDTIIARFRERAEQAPPGAWLTGRGYNEVELKEKRHPTRADLDAASPDHPIALTRTCGHMIVANSLALQLAGVTRDTPDPAGGVIARDADGEPTGLMQETAQGLITRVIPDYDDETMAAAVRAAQQHELSLGITSATDAMLTPQHVRVYRKLDEEGELAVRTNALPIRRPDGGSITLPLPEKYLSDILRIDSVKFFLDGGLSGATAAISLPYKEIGTYGVLRFEDEELYELMREAHAGGFRIASHAIGDVAIEQLLTTYTRLVNEMPGTGLRHRIEHLGLPSADQLRRAHAIGAIAVPQPVFLHALGSTYRRYLPDAYYPRCYPIRAMLDAGLSVAFSSDAPVVPDDNPLLGIRAAVDRRDASGQPIALEQGISLQEAIYCYTMGGAIASGDGDNRGSITSGKWADFAILNGDPTATPIELLPELRVEQTWVGGKLMYEAESGSPFGNP